MAKEPQVLKSTLPALLFRWRDKLGNFHDIRAMETSHLFNTLSMIWNHHMPEDANTHDYKRYRFPPFYTEDYMREAVKKILPELVERNDLTPEMKARIDFMADYVRKNPTVLGPDQKRLEAD